MKKKRLTRTISLILTLVLSLQLIPPALLGNWGSTAHATYTGTASGYDCGTSVPTDNTAIATALGTFDNETEIMEHPVPTRTEDGSRYLNILQRNTPYLNLSADDAEFLVNYTGISASDFETMSQSNISLADSIWHSSLAALANCDVSDIVELNLLEDDYKRISTQMALYNTRISSNVNAALDQELRGYILTGSTCEQVFNAYGTSQVLGISMSSLLDDNANQITSSSLTNTDAALVEDFSNNLSLSSNAVADYLVSNNISASMLVGQTAAINAAKASLMSVPQGRSNTDISQAGKSVFPEGISSPYAYNYNENEKVSLNSGSLHLNYTDYVLPGVNGLDLVISRSYDSQDSNIYTPTIESEINVEYEYYVYCVRVAYYDVPGIGMGRWPYYDEEKVLGPYLTEDAANNAKEWYECGGYLEIPNFQDGADLIVFFFAEVIPVVTSYSQQVYTSKVENTYLTNLYGLGHGWSFGFSSIETRNDQTVLHCADGSDYVVSEWSGNAAIFEDYTLIDKTLMRCNSEFTNGSVSSYFKLTYADGRREYFSDDGKLIGIQDRFDNTITLVHSTKNGYPYIEITDTMNRVVTISGEGTTASGKHTMKVTLPDGNTLTYAVENSRNGGKALVSYTDPVGKKTSYSYTEKSAGFDIFDKNVYGEANVYLNLTTVTHPTNAQTVYTYEPAYRNLGETGLMTVYRVTSRKDTVNGVGYNALTYSYSENDCSGYPKWADPENLPDDYTYSTTVEDSEGIITTATFKENHTISGIGVSDKSGVVQETFYAYNTNKLPVQTTIVRHGLGTMATVELAEYDEKGNVIASWSALAEGDRNDTEHKTTYTYDSAYNLPLMQTYKTDANTTIVVTNTLTADGKSIAETAVTVNGVLAQHTAYTYDANGNVISIVKYNTDGTSVQTDYTYQNGLLVSEECAGVEASYVYDAVGHLIESTDGRGYTTAYTYDAIGNVTSITHPDGKTVTYTRDYTANAVTVTDENRNSIKYTYTPLGQEYEVIAETEDGWYVVTRKSYDSKQRLIRVQDYVYGADTKYTYDSFGRVLSETVWQGSYTKLSHVSYSYDDALNGLYNKVTKTIVGDYYAPSIVTTQYTDKHGNVVMTGQVLGGTEHLDTYTYDYAGNVLTYLSAADEDTLQYTAKYEYNGLGQVVRTYNALGDSTTSTYDMLGRVIETTDYAGTPTFYEYDDLGRLIAQTITIEADVSATTMYEYDASGNLTVEYKPVQEVGGDEVWAKTTYSYDKRNRLIGVFQYDGSTVVSETTYVYDGVGNTLSMTAGGNTTTYTYDRFGNVLTMTDAMGKVESYTYSLLGRLESKTDRNGAVTTYGYDALGRVVETVTSLGDTLSYAYTLTGQVLWEQSDWQLTEYAYDELGRVVTVTETELTEVVAPKPFTVTLDPNGGTVSSTALTVWSTEPVELPVPERTGYTFEGWYNGDTLVTKKTAVYITEDCMLTAKWTANIYTIILHGNGGKLATGQQEIEIACTYDESVTLPENEFVLDGWEFVCWQRKLAENGAVLGNFGDGQTVKNLSTAQNGEVHLYAAWEEKTAASYTVILDATGGTVSTDRMTVVVGEKYALPTPTRTGYAFAGWYLGNTRISNGDTIELTGNATLTARWTANKYAIVYDLNGGSLLPGQTPTRQVCTYDLSVKLSTVVPSKNGHTFLGWGLSADGPVAYAPGAIVKNLTAQQQATVTLYAIWRSSGSATVPDVPEFPSDGGTYSLRSEPTYIKTYEYDLAGNRTHFILTKNGTTVHNITYTYDELHRLSEVYQSGYHRATYSYDANGNRVALTYATGTVTTYTYNKANWVTRLTSVHNGNTLQDYTYTYYADGNRRSETDWVNGEVTSYVYDDLGRLTLESETDGLTVEYRYDVAGNRTEMAVSGDKNYTVEYSYDANNRLTQEIKHGVATNYYTFYSYDLNGNLLQKGVQDTCEYYQYNGFNQLVALRQGDTGAAYGYNASSIRVSKQVGETYTYYLLDGGDVVAEYTDDSLSAHYVRGINLIRGKFGSTTRYYLHDAHGDVTALTNSSGTVTKRYSYDAFGNEENPSSDANPFRYCGEYFDKETGTYYLRARYYDPAIGRFTQQDPHWSPANMIYGDNPRKIYEGQDALGLSTYTYAPEISAIMQSRNLYVYCVGNPVAYWDYNGTALGQTNVDIRQILQDGNTRAIIAFGVSAIICVSVSYANSVNVASKDVAQSWLKDQVNNGGENLDSLNNHTVYVIYKTGTTDAYYVGRTCDFKTRRYAHQRDGGRFPTDQYTMIPVRTGLSLEKARALEETLIFAFVSEATGEILLENSIHSIAYKNWGQFTEYFDQVCSLLSGLAD